MEEMREEAKCRLNFMKILLLEILFAASIYTIKDLKTRQFWKFPALSSNNF